MSIPGSASPLFLTSAAAAGPAAAFQIDRSLRFNSADSAYLSRTPLSAGNRRTFTFSCWVKRTKLARETIFSSGSAVGTSFGLEFNASDKLDIYDYNSSFTWRLQSTAVFRDLASFFHLVLSVDTTQATASNTVKVYINGSQITNFDTSTYPSQNHESFVNNNVLHTIGSYQNNTFYSNALLSDIQFVDGQALAPTDFGQTDSDNNWNPKDTSGLTFGTNGFKLNFSDNSSNLALGYDATATASDPNPDGGMDVVTYAGNSGTQTISGLAFQPDFVWIKARNHAVNHILTDSIRGTSKELNSNTNGAENDQSGYGLTAFTPNGFSVKDTNGGYGVNGNYNYVAWAWKAGGTPSANTNGDITTQVSVNSAYGFSISTWTSPSSADTNGWTLGHGLPSAPKFMLVKNRSSAGNWTVFHTSLGNTKALYLNDSGTGQTNQSLWNNTDPTDSVWSAGSTGWYGESNNFVTYAWCEIPGFSKFGTFTHSSTTSLDFGFKPKYWLVKEADGTTPWYIFDAERDNFDDPLFANTDGTAGSGFAFTVGNTGISWIGGSFAAGTYIYAAFADRPGNNFDVNNLVATAGVDGAKGFKTVTYTGNGGTQTISGLAFQPDVVWLKRRDATANHRILDSVRGSNKELYPNLTNAEATFAGISSFNSDGFTLNTSDANYNGSSNTYVAWCWNSGANSNKTYTVKVVSDSGNKYRFDDFGTSAVTLDLQEGSTYVFDQSDSSNAGHPIRFGTSANGTNYTTGVTHTGTPGSAGAKTTLVLGTGVATLYYSCLNHTGMGGQINTNSTAGASNFDGSIQAVAKADNTYGFSCVSYTGNGGAATIGHGLSSAPKWIIKKFRSATSSWDVYHESVGAGKRLVLNTTAAEASTSSYQNVNSSTFDVHAGNNDSGVTMIAYCWSEVSGFSKFGSYAGDGGTKTITTGFKPAFILSKSYDTGSNWHLLDSKRGSAWLEANGDATENSNSNIVVTYLDNGFTVNGSNINNSGTNYVYMAFADMPDNTVIDSLIDTPTNYTADSGNNGGNYCTWNPLSTNSTPTFSDGNLTVTNSGSGSSGWRNIASTMAVSSGKWYMEFQTVGSMNGGLFIGIQKVPEDNDQFNPASFSNNFVGMTANSYSLNAFSGNKRTNGSDSSYGSGQVVNDILMMAVDLDNGKIWWGKNGTWFASGDPDSGTNAAFTGLSGTFVFAVGISANEKIHSNWGQRPFAYSNNISGFNSVCTQNLPDPTIADGSTAFDAKVFTGDGSAKTVTGYGFQPDMIWLKNRSISSNQEILDAVRGVNAMSFPNDNQVENTSTDRFTSFNSDGFTIGTGSNSAPNGNSNIAWAWDAGASTVSNTDGSITSSVRASQASGFSIVLYTGNGTAGATIGHGLNAAPELIIAKCRSNNENWRVYTKTTGNTKSLFISTNEAPNSSSNYWNSTSPTSSVFSVGNDSGANNNGYTYFAYCFAPVAGYSAFGSYTGNGSSDGPFVFTGFRVALLAIKRTDSTGAWKVLDTSRSPFNVASEGLDWNTSGSEFDNSENSVDILSNGFKLRTSHGARNASGGTFLYMAWAEHPLKTARAR